MGWVRPCSGPASNEELAGGAHDKEHATSQKLNAAIAVIGIDIGKNSFHIMGHDYRGAIVLRQNWSRGQVETQLANLPPCIAIEACVGAHHLSRKLQVFKARRDAVSFTASLTHEGGVDIRASAEL